MILNLSNPKLAIAWTAAFSIDLGADADTGVVVAATLVCIVVGFATNGLYSVLFSINGMMLSYQRCRRKINGTMAVLFGFAGSGMIRSAFID